MNYIHLPAELPLLGGGVDGVTRPDGGGVATLGGGVEGVILPEGGVFGLGGGVDGVARPETGGVGDPTRR